MLQVLDHVAADMAAHARNWYPAECCGLLLGSGTRIRAAIRMDNLKDQYHQRFPDDFPRSSRDAFKLDASLRD